MWQFVRTRKALGTTTAGDCFHVAFQSFRMFFQTLSSVSMSLKRKMGKICSISLGKHFHYVNSSSKFCVCFF